MQVIFHIKRTCHSAARHSSPMSSFSDFTCRFSSFHFLQSFCLAATPPPARLFSRNSVGVSILLAPDRNADGNDGHTSFRRDTHYHIENNGVIPMSKSFENHHSERQVIFRIAEFHYSVVNEVRTVDSSSHQTRLPQRNSAEQSADKRLRIPSANHKSAAPLH